MPFDGEADDDLAEPAPEVGAALGQREDRHDLGRGRDDEAGFARRAVRRVRQGR